jgi:predicted dehydrogenase
VEAQYALKRYASIDELMAVIDAADIVAPTNHHFDICQKALRSQKHVFVEKPLAATIEEAQEIVKLVKEAKVKFQVGHVERFNPAFMAARKYTTQPMFIEVHRLAQFNPRGTEVSVILDLMIHDLDIVLSLVKSPVKNIYASGVAVMTDTPDIANVRIEFNNGCVANLTSSRISMKKMRKIRLFQKDAYIGIDFLARKTEIIKIKQDSDENAFSFDLETPKGKKIIAIANPDIKDNNPIKLELEAFRDAIEHNTPTVVSEVDGYLAMEVAQQILDRISNTAVFEG